MVANGFWYVPPSMFVTSGPWLTPRPYTKRPGCSAVTAGTIAVTTFDGPLMAINYARAAQTDFTEMQVLEQRLMRARPDERPSLSAELADRAATFSGDLEVAAQRSSAADERKLIAQLAPLVQRWQQA